MENIETGVDKLVTLIKRHGKTSLRNAAKELGVSKSVVLEWAELLDEENIVSIQYGFFDSIITLKQFNDKEIEGKNKEFVVQKDVFVSKIDNAIITLDTEHNGLKKLQKEFNDIKLEISKDLGSVKGKIQKLDNYHKMKHEIDKEMMGQKSKFENYINDMNKKIESENSKYSELIKIINKKESEIEKDKKEAIDIEILENELKTKLNNIIKVIQDSSKKLNDDSQKIIFNKKELNSLKKKAEEIKNNIIDKRLKIKKVIDKSKAKENKISNIQDYIRSVIESKTSDIKNSDNAKKLENLFNKKNMIQKKIMDIEKEHNDLENELKNLRKKAIGLKVISGKSTSIEPIVQQFNELSKKKETYHDNIKNLFNFMTK